MKSTEYAIWRDEYGIRDIQRWDNVEQAKAERDILNERMRSYDRARAIVYKVVQIETTLTILE